MRSLCWIAFLLFLAPALLVADADRQDWVGEYAMNHDGHLGTLRITQAKCRPNLPCIGLKVGYVDEHGSEYGGSIAALDDNGQHMRFTIEFPGNPQVFDVYIFSFDKNKMAGTTVWGGRTFGVLALKTASRLVVAGLASPVHRTGAVVGAEYVGPRRGGTGSSAEPSGSPTRVLLPDGTIEMRYPDGTVKSKKFGNCGWNTRYPDGHTVPSMCAYSQTIPVVPPPPPSGSKEEKWLLAQDDNLLAIIQTVLGGASSADYQNYLQNYENPPESVLYKQIYYRTQAIEELTSTPQ